MDAETIVTKVIAMVACLMCATPLLIISKYQKNSQEPINFWSGDKTLKSKVGNVAEYNREMAALYQKCAIVFILTGIIFVISIPVGVVVLVLFDCSTGIYVAYRCYKKILNRWGNN